MTEERLNELLADAAHSYRSPPEVDLGAMWPEVERRAFDRPFRRPAVRTPSWRVFTMAIAASLLVGVALGRGAFRHAPAASVAAMPGAASADSAGGSMPAAYDRTATELLDRSAILLTALPTEARRAGQNEQFTSQARELLTTTRLLMDSPAASNPRFKELLQDLELVLAQVARLKAAGGHGHEEIDLITDALQERDVVPRIRSAAARISLGDG
jgi:hypothetical protein